MRRTSISRLIVFVLLIGFSTPVIGETDKITFEQYTGIDAKSPSVKASLSAGELQFLFNFVANHPVAKMSRENIAKYDPQGIIGFCFGRSMAVKLAARRMGLKRENIKMLFVLGDLRSGDDPEWRFHVTTLVSGGSGWMAIDPIMTKPMSMEAWIKKIHSVWDRGKKAHFYMVGDSVVLPDIRYFAAPDKETGKRIIELSFDPKGRPGFFPSLLGFATYYSMSTANVEEHFMDVYEKADERFDFLSISVNGAPISYNNYFVDLVNDIATRATLFFMPVTPFSEGLRMRTVGIASNKNLHSFRLRRI